MALDEISKSDIDEGEEKDQGLSPGSLLRDELKKKEESIKRTKKQLSTNYK